MAIDRKYIGYRLAPIEVTVDVECVRRFAAAIGAQSAGIDDGVVPPTYLKVIEGERNSSRTIVAALSIDLRRVIHVEQEFEYGPAIRSGDRLIVERGVSDIYERKEGMLEFVVIESCMRRDDGAFAGRSRQVIVVRNVLRTES